MTEIKCYLFDIVEPNPDSISMDTWLIIQEKMQNSNLMGEPGKRFGFLSPNNFENMIYGYFIMEGEKPVIQYTDDKLPITPPNAKSFEKLFFTIFRDTSQILLQQKNIYGYVDLGLPKIRKQFLLVITDFLRICHIHVSGEMVQIEPAITQFTQDELLSFFLNNRSIKLEVEEFTLSNIPPKDSNLYHLYNPHDEWDDITWCSVEETAKKGTRKIIFEGDEKSLIGINKGPLPKAFAQIGTIREVKSYNSNGHLVIRKKNGDEEISIEIPSESEITPEVIDSILDKMMEVDRVETWKVRKNKRDKNKFDGTMFSKLE